MSGWQETTLGEEANLITGFPFKSSQYTDNENDIPLVRGDNIVQGRLRWDGVKRWPVDDTTIDESYKLRDGDVVLAMDRPWIEAGLKFAVISRFDLPCYLVQRVACLRGKEQLCSVFLRYLIASKDFTQHILSVETGSAVPHISGSQIKEFIFQRPPLEEQKSIASVLSSLDDKIDLLHRQNKTLEAMAETLFRQWFVEGVGDWESGKISDLIDVLSGFAFKSTSFVESGIYRLMTIKAVQDGYLETNNADRIAEIPANMPSYCNLQEGDILLSLTGNVGRCCLVDDEKLLLNQRVAKLRPKNERDHAFAYVMFRQVSMRAMLEEMAKGTAQANLSPVEMANMEIQIPPDDVLSNFSLAATPMLKKLLFNKLEIKTLEKLRDSLLPKLMSGEVRVA